MLTLEGCRSFYMFGIKPALQREFWSLIIESRALTITMQ
jgi:hypothetical protein